MILRGKTHVMEVKAIQTNKFKYSELKKLSERCSSCQEERLNLDMKELDFRLEIDRRFYDNVDSKVIRSMKELVSGIALIHNILNKT